MGASRAPNGLGSSPATGRLALELFSGSQNSVTARRSQIANVLSILSVDVTLPGSGGLGSLPALAMLGNGADISSIPDPALRQLEPCLPSVQIRMTLTDSVRTVRLANRQVVTVYHEIIAIQPTVHTPWVPIVLNSELYVVMFDSDLVCILDLVNSDKFGLNLNSDMFHLGRAAPRTMPVSSIENPSNRFGRRAAVCTPAFHMRGRWSRSRTRPRRSSSLQGWGCSWC